MRTHFKIIALSLILTGVNISNPRTTQASAGGTGTHGGDAIICGASRWTQFKSLLSELHKQAPKVYLADTFEVNEAQRALIEEIRIPEARLEKLALDTIAESDAQMGIDLRTSLSAFKWIYVDDLPELDDDDIGGLPKNCRKQQLAIQDLKTGEVKVNRKLHQRMPALEHVFLKLHEAYIRNEVKPEVQLQNTRRIREKVRAVMAGKAFIQRLEDVRWERDNRAQVLTYQFYRFEMSQFRGDFASAGNRRMYEMSYYRDYMHVNFDYLREFRSNFIAFLENSGGKLRFGVTRKQLYEETANALLDPSVRLDEMGAVIDRLFVFPAQ